MNKLTPFAGAGGEVLAGHLLGWRTICAVERDAYAAQVLAQRQNNGVLPPFPIWADVRSFDCRHWRGLIDVVSGGFPCRDISGAGPGTGIEGSRSGLWKDMARIIGEVLPSDVYLENSPMLVGRGLAMVLGELTEMGCRSIPRSPGSRSDGPARWPSEPDMGRVADGVVYRMDRLKTLGNDQVPRVAATAFHGLHSGQW